MHRGGQPANIEFVYIYFYNQPSAQVLKFECVNNSAEAVIFVLEMLVIYAFIMHVPWILLIEVR